MWPSVGAWPVKIQWYRLMSLWIDTPTGNGVLNYRGLYRLKIIILKMTWNVTGNQCRQARTGEIWSNLVTLDTSLIARFWACFNFQVNLKGNFM